MKKSRIFVGLLATILVITFIFTGCAQPAPAPAPAPSPTPAPAPAPAEPIKLSLSYYMSTKSWLHTGVFVPWKEDVEKATNGRVIIEIFPGAALGKAPDHYDMVINGICDIGWSLEGYTPGRFPLSSVIELPFLTPSVTAGGKIFWQLYQEFPEIQAEYKEVKLLAPSCTSSMDLGLREGAAARVPDDIKGKTLRVHSDVLEKFVTGAGASGAGIPMAEVYTSLETGVVDGLITDAGIFLGFKISEVAPYATVLDIARGAMFTAMNLDTWNSLPPDIQKILGEDLGGLNLTDRHQAAKEKHVLAGHKYMKENGKEFYELTAGEREQWVAIGKTIHEDWIKDMEAEGLPGQKVYDRAVALAKELSK